jgi:hypothetical protein
MTAHPRRLLAALVLAGAAAGCGQASSTSSTPPPAASSADGADLAQTLAQAAATTTKAGSARFAMRMTMSTPQGGFTMRGRGIGSFTAPRRMSFDFAMRLPSGAGSLDMTERLVGTTIYMRSPMLTQKIPGHKPWLKMDLDAIGRSQGVSFSALMNSSSSDPAQVLTYLKGVADGVQVVGNEAVAGVPTTHYRAVVSFRRMLDRLPPRARRQWAQSLERTSGVSPDATEPMDVWIDGQGRARQERMKVDMPKLASSMTVLVTMTDFGVPVHVTAPPAGRTADLSALLGAAGATS